VRRPCGGPQGGGIPGRPPAQPAAAAGPGRARRQSRRPGPATLNLTWARACAASGSGRSRQGTSAKSAPGGSASGCTSSAVRDSTSFSVYSRKPASTATGASCRARARPASGRLPRRPQRRAGGRRRRPPVAAARSTGCARVPGKLGLVCAGRRFCATSAAGRPLPRPASALLLGPASWCRPRRASCAWRRRRPPARASPTHSPPARHRVGPGRACARSASRSQGHSSAWLQAASCGGRRHRRCPATSTTPGGPARAARYSASVSHGVAASAVGPKLVGPAHAPAAWAPASHASPRAGAGPPAQCHTPSRARAGAHRPPDPGSPARPGLARAGSGAAPARRAPRAAPAGPPYPLCLARRHSRAAPRRRRACAARRQRQRRVRQWRDRVKFRVRVGAPGRPGASGSGGYGSGEMGTTAAYAWLSTRAAAAGGRPARLSRRSSSTGRPPAAPRTQRSTTASALPPAGAAP